MQDWVAGTTSVIGGVELKKHGSVRLASRGIHSVREVLEDKM